ncbi:hypothetical protein K0504_04465 [Neiella marina]|uniref:Tyr recombinase domain-containing protein n=1 Tax=Neiella holothuriorum TaxID=2870530 RepID=A0ABS7EF19_9GAMM|nr:hypothetical protein [Neiella holothuriorum]MBW8190282.1 hypothetical protein [Neiella holothuriorum]
MVFVDLQLRQHQALARVRNELDDDEFDRLLSIIISVDPPPNLVNVARIASNLAKDYKTALECVEWPGDVRRILEFELNVLTPLAHEDKSHLTSNPFRRHFGDFAIASLFAERYAQNLTPNNRQLLSLLRFTFLLVSRRSVNENKFETDGPMLCFNATELRKAMAKQSFPTIPLPLDVTQLCKLICMCPKKLDIPFQDQFVDASLAVIQRTSVAEPPTLRIRKPAKSRSTFDNPDQILDKTADRHAPNVCISLKYIPSTLTRESDEHLVEVTSFKEQSDELGPDKQGLHSAMLYGSRLALRQKMLLPWRTDVLSSEEASIIIPELVRVMKNGDAKAQIPAVVTLFSLITSKPISYLYDLTVSKKAFSGEGVSLKLGVWFRMDIQMPQSFVPSSSQQRWLDAHDPLVALPLPTALLSCLEQLLIDLHKDSIKLADLSSVPLERLVVQFLQTISKPFGVLHRRITPAAVRSFAYQQIAMKCDPGFANLLLANTEYQSPTQLYYLALPHVQLVDAYKQFLGDKGLVHTHLRPSTVMSGSRLCLQVQLLRRLLAEKRHELELLLNMSSSSLDQLIATHNALAGYTVLLALVFTGHRDRSEYSFNQTTIAQAQRGTILCDKVNFAESALRLVALPDVFFEQLTVYRKHCGLLAKKLKDRAPQLATRLTQISHNQLLLDCPLFGEIDEILTWKGIGTVFMKGYLGSPWSLPLNAFRHSYCSMWRRYGYGQFAGAAMGHVGAGEHVYDPLSLMLTEYLDSMRNVVELYAEELQCKAAGRAKVFVGPTMFKKLNEKPYYPKNLNRTLVTNSKAIAQARQLIEPFRRELKGMGGSNSAVTLRQQIIEHALTKRHEFKSERNFTKVLSYLNRFIEKSTYGRKANQYWLLTLDQTIGLDYEQNYSSQLMYELKRKLTPWLAGEVNCQESELLPRFLISAIVNGQIISTVTAQMLRCWLREARFVDGFLSIADKESGLRQGYIFDSITSGLWLNLRRQPETLIDYNIIAIDKCFRQQLLRVGFTFSNNVKSTIRALQGLVSRSFDGGSVLMGAISRGELPSTGLNVERLARLLTSKIAPNEHERHIEPNIRLKTFNYGSEESVQANDKAVFKELRATLLSNKGTTNRNLQSVVKSVWAQCIRSQAQASVDELCIASTSLSSTAIAILYWLYKVAGRPGKGRKSIAVGTLRTYLSAICNPALEHAGELNFFDLNEDEYTEFYNRVLDCRDLENRPLRASILRDFHHTLERFFELPELEWQDIEPRVSARTAYVDANLLDSSSYNMAVELLLNGEFVDNAQRLAQASLLVACFKLGLRAGEFQRLRVGDINLSEWVVHVRSNRFGRTKSPNSNRRIACGFLLTDLEKSIITQQCKLAQSAHPNGDPLLLFDPNHIAVPRRFRETFEPLVYLLRQLTGEPNLKLHHCRHGFVSYLMVIFHPLFDQPVLSQLGQQWLGVDDSEYRHRRNQLVKQWVGDLASPHKHSHAIALAVGHAEAHTTLHHYCHVAELLSYVERAQINYQDFEIKQVAQLVNRTAGSARQIVKRYGHVDGRLRALLRRAEWPDEVILKLEKKPLVDVNSRVKTTYEQKSELIADLGRINRQIRLYIDLINFSDIAIITGDSTRIVVETVLSTETVIRNVGYRALDLPYIEQHERAIVNRRLAKSLSRLTQTQQFRSLLTQLVVQNSVDELFELVKDWEKNQSYLPVINGTHYEQKLRNVLTSTGLTIKKQTAVPVRGTTEIDYVRWAAYKEGHSRSVTVLVNHILFLLCVRSDLRI